MRHAAGTPMELYADTAWLPHGWAREVTLGIDESGRIAEVRTGSGPPGPGASRMRGPLLPGIANLHSHAFQRAFAGLAERRGGASEDSFWTWREILYGFVSRITPDDIEAIAAQLYVEMLKAGYVAVGEFHYLHHDSSGRPYADVTELSDRVIAAAEQAGIAITHLPVLYAHGGFGGQPPLPGQARFVNGIERYTRLVETLFERYAKRLDVRIGIAPHSLRAVTPELLGAALAHLATLDPNAPVHIHIAEQVKEVTDCEAWCGRRPIEWLLDEFEVDRRWCLVHATHASPHEVVRLARCGAVTGLCPTTEANLGDGLFPAPEFVAENGVFGIGSDSHVSVSPIEELRLLEYGQRLRRQRRNVITTSERSSVGASLYAGALAGGARALGSATGAISTGMRADLIVIDPDAPALLDKSGDLLLDAMIFAGNVNPVRDVMVGGRWCVEDGHHFAEHAVFDRFRRVQRAISTRPC